MKKFLASLLCGLGGGLFCMTAQSGGGVTLPVSDLLVKVRQSVRPALDKAAGEKQLKVGEPVFIRIFKETMELEVWLHQPMGAL
jgi:murein L,D-transpeptidase YafK